MMASAYEMKARDCCRVCGGTGEKPEALRKQEGGWKCQACSGDGWISPSELPDMTDLEAIKLVLEITADAWERLSTGGDNYGECCDGIGRIERFCEEHLQRHKQLKQLECPGCLAMEG